MLIVPAKTDLHSFTFKYIYKIIYKCDPQYPSEWFLWSGLVFGFWSFGFCFLLFFGFWFLVFGLVFFALHLDPIAERNLSAKFWINWKIFRGRTVLLFFPITCNALQYMLKQWNATDDLFDVAHASDFKIIEIEEDGTKREWKLCGVGGTIKKNNT